MTLKPPNAPDAATQTFGTALHLEQRMSANHAHPIFNLPSRPAANSAFNWTKGSPECSSAPVMAVTDDQRRSDAASSTLRPDYYREVNYNGHVDDHDDQQWAPHDKDGSHSPNLSFPSSQTSTLPTISSDEDRTSEEDDSLRNSSPRKGRSRSSSISEHLPPPALDHVETTSNGTETNAKVEDEAVAKSRSRSGSGSVQKLSAAGMQELTSSPDSLPIAPAPERRSIDQEVAVNLTEQLHSLRSATMKSPETRHPETFLQSGNTSDLQRSGGRAWQARDFARRPPHSPRTVSTPPTSRCPTSFDATAPVSSPRRFSFNPAAQRPTPLNLNLDGINMPPPEIKTAVPVMTTPGAQEPPTLGPIPSPMPNKMPLPPMSIHTHLQLEIAAQRPSPLYIYRPHSADTPYESMAVKFERLQNVLVLPGYLERTLCFGALACFDAWLYNFTILPIRFVLSVSVLVRWWAYVVGKEARWMVSYVWEGIGRLRERGRSRGAHRSGEGRAATERSRSRSTASEFSVDIDGTPTPRERLPTRPRGDSHFSNGHTRTPYKAHDPGPRTGTFRHKRTKSTPSNLTTFHKADLLQGLVIICSSMMLMTLDASRMYHFIRAQSAIKLYVIYNILEVGDRLLSALGQDILECLFSTETLSRNASGRSKVLMPLGMFILALAYCCLHSMALYYQVITLNVAVNSYSNALLTLLLSNQFVEIKSTVFKRFEKDNLFQLTCADIVERFQLWIMLLIIGMRNFVEVGGLTVPGAAFEAVDEDTKSGGPLHNSSVLPHSFTVLPSWLMSGEVLSPFLIVIGSEMLVDTIKHAYVTKFNNIKPNFYSRILDILCKDYYTNAFMTPSLTRRLGLAVIPLSCLFIRASFQTYHMFLSTHLPMPSPPSTQTSLADASATPSSPAVIAALNRFDSLLRDSLGRATYGYPSGSPLNSRSWYSWTSDDFIAALTMIVFFFIAFLVLLITKLLLGMVLLKYSRARYAQMRNAETAISNNKAGKESYDHNGRRVGGYGQVEVGDERQRWIHADENEGLKGGKGPGGKRIGIEDKKPKGQEYNGVNRYEMVAKRIW